MKWKNKNKYISEYIISVKLFNEALILTNEKTTFQLHEQKNVN